MDTKSHFKVSSINVGILIVLYQNTEDELERLFRSIYNQTYKNFKVYLIDNSDNESCSLYLLGNNFPNIYLEKSQGNIGYSKANNLLAKRAIIDGCKYLFILNPDMELTKNTLEVFVNLMENNFLYGVCSSILIYGNTLLFENKIQLYGGVCNYNTLKKRFLFANMKLTSTNLPNLVEVTMLSGGALFISSKIFNDIGMFEERYFMYNEEADLLKRIYDRGYKAIVTSLTKIYHHHDYSKKNIYNYKLMYYYIMRNRMLYFKKFKLYFYMIFDIFFQIISFPLKIKMFYKIGSLSILKYYYLGLLRGLLGETGKSNINFK